MVTKFGEEPIMLLVDPAAEAKAELMRALTMQ